MSEEPSTKKQKTREPLIINFFQQGTVNTQPSGLWSYPGDISSNYKKLNYWTDLARKAEAAKINSIFIADVLGPYDVYKGPKNFGIPIKAGVQTPGIDPSAPITAMASVTQSLGFGITFSTISEHPYHFARRLASLDHLTDGRIGWNIVSSYLESAARNLLSGQELPERLERYRKTEEYVLAVYELLLSSWRIDSIKADPKTHTYAEPSLVREINFKGDYYDIPGPGYTEPSPQSIPLLFQAGSSPGGIELASKHAEVVFLNGGSPEILKSKIDNIKQTALKYDRNPSSLKFITLAMVIVGKTHEEAVAKYESYANQADPEGALALLGGWVGIDFNKYDDEVDLLTIEDQTTKNIVKSFCTYLGYDQPITKSRLARHVSVKGSTDLFLGSIEEVADEIEKWVNISGLNGFNFASSVNPNTFDDLVDLLLPELRKRGLAQLDYPVPNGTFRENTYKQKGQTFVPPDHLAFKYRWTKGTNEEFTKELNKHKEWIEERRAKSGPKTDSSYIIQR
ncbi:putative monooxygenase [Wickerhamomyces ciferrii]|uniref:Monooxygenase n=1 Tax=Wickerhamomyces ciferrii (strain ATCC 14091 / BCRC 22168 / CBS 111 / JCM 3599 / NBRC 0793 / NRRL Y-1031 F-60-10) TaxID=1206466 RepID=K0KPZ1_WICCF|nr:putative monooxygenase [Wickerhamomyces ciferrii]CCH43243.1 putative monooxygenase [Wickerhamomyces ciferrii]